MTKGRSKTKTQQLGRSLLKTKKNRHVGETFSERHTVNEEQSNGKSITENTSLDDFLSTAEMSNKLFTAEREEVKLVRSEAIQPLGIVSEENLEDELLIPRRPKWDKNTTSEELHHMENESYLKWRRRLAQLQERDDIVLTPFEKNLDFWRQLWRVVERSDILVQILDARNPLLFFSEDLDSYIKEVDENKLCVILLNKSDYLTEQQRKQWLIYFNSIGKVCVFFSALQQQESQEHSETDVEQFINQLETLKINNELDKPLAYDELILYFKSLRSQLTTNNPSITVGLIGYPNVGKSSTINALLRMKCVSVSSMPGKTKHFQTINLDDEITICDCPGLVFPNIVSSKSEMIINGILPIDQMKDALQPIATITSKIPAHVFESLYGIVLPKVEDDDDDRRVSALELLTAYGYAKGFMTQRGLPDTSRAARYILKDFVNGKLLFCYAPPTEKQDEYHTYVRKESVNRTVIDQRLIRAFEGNNLTSKDFDREYFQEKNSSAHTKGSIGIANHSRNFIQNGNEAFPVQEGKPWRKHNNRNKREKLRRVYAHLDQ
ncbi:large subunit GTPase 1 [Blomia tropicalis]|nr:large subunit GTPase 1 [Blomia tropicalis]